MTIEVLEYTAPSSWAVAALYGDTTGMSDEEEQAFNEWLESINGRCVSVDDDHGFLRYHDAARYYPYASECSTFVFHKNA